jgi:ubiquinone/menaquinone biosynthesis C-methylase UbiE
VGTGAADIPIAISDWARRAEHRVEIVAIDLHPVTVEAARKNVAARPEIRVVQADALKLMDQFSPASFDYVHAGMFLHHLQDIEALTVLRIMDRLATRGCIWNDLVRNFTGRLGAFALTLTAPPKVRHDAIVSVAAGFARREAIELARRAGWQNPCWRRHLAYRFTVTSGK